MKTKLHFLCLIFLLVFAGLNHGLAATAHSKTYGGHWNVASTWEENYIPGPNDTAYIEGPVGIGTVVGYEIFHSYAGWVIVEPQGQLYPVEYGGGLGIFILYVEHDIVNNGRLTNAFGVRNEELLNINVKGNVTNNNYWRAYQTDLSGVGNQNLTLAVGKSFGGIWSCTTPHSITALSNMRFDCIYSYQGTFFTADFNLNGSVFHLGNFSINSSGTLIYKGTLEGNFEILGNFRVNKFVEDTLVFIGNVTVTDTLESYVYGGGYGIQKLKIIGNIINNGVVRDREDGRNADDLNILITGDITNNGIWTCNYVNLIGTETQYIEQSPGKQFVSNFYDLDASSDIVANTDITITKDIALNGSTINMQGYMLTLTSWLSGGNIENAKLHGGYLNSVTATGSITIYGTVTIDNGNHFNCPVTVEDTLRSNTYGGGACYFDLMIDGGITNNGVIKNYDPGHWFRIYVTGNIRNNGVWSNYTTLFTGDNNQSISQEDGTSFTCDFESQNTAGNITALSDLHLLGSFNLNAGMLKMEGYRITLHNWIYNGFLDNAILRGGIIQGISASDKLMIEGTVTVDDNNHLMCDVTVNDTLQCNTYGGGSKYYDLPIEGSLSNYGLIISFGSGMLRLYISGNLLNAGEWTNHLTSVKVIGELVLELVDNMSIEGDVQFEALEGPGPYQWSFNDAPLDSPDFSGENSQVLTCLVPVSNEWYGRFTCENGSKTPVGITVRQWITGIEENQTCNAGIWSYNNWLMVDLKENCPAEVMVYDLSGRMLASCNINNGLTAITLDKPGVYFVKVQAGKKLACKKVVIS
ncbi:MAG: T9SS type A sorting domain-containing protein [Lentimicrobium sp.]|jgi:hypothetical protein|nr:T9SS type A sorting domain-containing protein [Lentimicrobium sp.]